MKAAKGFGMESRLHVDEFVDGGGLQLASELGSVSGDHVEIQMMSLELGLMIWDRSDIPTWYAYILGKKLEFR